jgi:hemerythrin
MAFWSYAVCGSKRSWLVADCALRRDQARRGQEREAGLSLLRHAGAWREDQSGCAESDIAVTDNILLLRTGIAEIDVQHAGLVKCLDDLVSFIGGPYEFSAGFTAIQELLEYVKKHFAFEEELLAAHDYPLLDEHIAEHQAIASEVQKCWAGFEQGFDDISQQLVVTIRKWILDHINAEDIEYAKFLGTSPK